MEIKPELESFALIKVVGVGGSGGGAITRMIDQRVRGVDFVAINTDAQALYHCLAPEKVHVGKETTRGLGAGSDPELGKKAAQENSEEIYQAVKGADMVFITCGLGGGTGTGAAPIVAEIAREAGALTVAVVTKPFAFEGAKRRRIADEGWAELRDKVDTLITIPNDKILQLIDKQTSLLDSFRVVDDVLYQAVSGIADLITQHGIINVDFADVKSIMAGAGTALMGIGRASGEQRAVEAAKQAISSPLLDISVNGAKGVLINISGGTDLGMFEVDEAAKTVTDSVDADANIIWGAVLDESLEGEVKVTVIATGFEGASLPGKIVTGHHEPQNYWAGVTRDEAKEEEEKESRSFWGKREEKEEEKEEHHRAPAHAGGHHKTAANKTEHNKEEEDELEIPAFIRRKME